MIGERAAVLHDVDPGVDERAREGVVADPELEPDQAREGLHRQEIGEVRGQELGEAKVLKLALDCGAIVKNVYNVLEPALKRRNAAAHPNNVVLTPLQTEAFIEDLVNNAILKIV